MATESRLAQLTLIHDEIERQVTGYQGRVARLDQRAGLLLAAGGIAVSLLGQSSDNGWRKIAIALAVVAAIAAVVTLLPRATFSMRAERIREQVYGRSVDGALLYLIDMKMDLLENNEGVVKVKAYAVRVGFIAFAIAAIFVLISATPLDVEFDFSTPPAISGWVVNI